MTSTTQLPRSTSAPKLSVDTNAKAKAYVAPSLRSPSTAALTQSYISPDVKARAALRAQEYLHGSNYNHRSLYTRPSDSLYRSSILTATSPVRATAAPVANSVSAGYVQYQPPSYEVTETHTAQREREVTVEVPKYRTYVHYQPEAYEIEETHTAHREKEVTVEVPKYRTFVHYQPETYEVEETHHAQREKEVTVEIPKYTTYHTYQPETYEVTETHTAVREKEVTVEVPIYKEYTYCTPGKVETVYDYIAPKEHTVYNAVQSVRYELVTDHHHAHHGHIVNTSQLTVAPHELQELVKSTVSSPVKSSYRPARASSLVAAPGYKAIGSYTAKGLSVKNSPVKKSAVEVDEKCYECGQKTPSKGLRSSVLNGRNSSKAI